MESQDKTTVEPKRDDIIAALKTVQDPELMLDIWFLGLVYDIEICDRTVAVAMTFTTPMCPAGPMLIEDVEQKIRAVPGVKDVEVRIVFTPPWEPSDDVKALLGMI